MYIKNEAGVVMQVRMLVPDTGWVESSEEEYEVYLDSLKSHDVDSELFINGRSK